jgi:tRNA A-37 threonylcarbamoyl transferase component Bud32
MFSHFLRKVFPFAWRVTTAPTLAVRRGRRVWHLTPDGEALLGPAGPDFDGWLADGSCELVKTGSHRTVYQVRLGDVTVYMKHCRINGPRAWFREVVRPAKARLEFENAFALRERGIPAAVPLAWGEADSRLPGESLLITRTLDGIPFLRFVDDVVPTLPVEVQPAIRRQVAVGLGQFMAKVHDAGVAHPDPHAGNFVVELPGSCIPHFALLDLHAIRVGRPLGSRAAVENLVLYNRWFQMRATRTDRLRFWRSYLRARHTLTGLDGVAPPKALERQTLDSNLGFWAGREHRCLGTNRYFRRVKRGHFRGHAVRDLPESVVADVLADPDGVFTRAGVTVLKNSRTSTVAELVIPMADGPRAVVLKRMNVRRPSELLKNLIRRSPAIRSWVNGHSLRDRWLPTPRPLLAFHRYRTGLPAEGYLLVEKVADAVGLPEAVSHNGRTRAVIRNWVHRIGRTLRAVHDRAVSHRDLKAANVMIEGVTDPLTARPVLIDLVGVRTRIKLPLPRRARELARLNASFITSPHVTNGDRLRLLHAYLSAGPALGADWKSWWKLVSRATEAKVDRNRRVGRPLA